MALPYTKQGPFVNDTSPALNATRVNAMDQGIWDLDQEKLDAADGDARYVRSAVASVAALVALTPADGEVRRTLGYFASNDGGGGPPWRFYVGDTTTADGGSVVANAGNTGRWKRVFEDKVSAAAFGMLPGRTGAQNKTALVAAITHASTGLGQVVALPPGTLSCDGGITQPANVVIQGASPGATQVNHGTDDVWVTSLAQSYGAARGWKEFRLVGNAGTSAKGIVFGNTSEYPEMQGLDIRSYTNGTGLELRNSHATLGWTEEAYMERFRVQGCKYCIDFQRDQASGGLDSFSSTRMKHVQITLNGTGQTGIRFDENTRLYFGEIEAKIAMIAGANSCIGIDLGTFARLENSRYAIGFEIASGLTSSYRVKLAGTARFSGQGFVTTFPGAGNLPDNIDTTARFLVPVPATPDVGSAAFLPTNAKAETFARTPQTSAALTAATSGQLHLHGIYLKPGMRVTTITFMSGTTALAGGSNQWFALYDKNYALLGVTNDDTSTAWAASTRKTLTLATPYDVPAYIFPEEGIFYLGICIVATTTPTLMGQFGTGAVNAVPPVLAATSTTGLTNPASAPNPATSVSGMGPRAWAYVT